MGDIVTVSASSGDTAAVGSFRHHEYQLLTQALDRRKLRVMHAPCTAYCMPLVIMHAMLL